MTNSNQHRSVPKRRVSPVLAAAAVITTAALALLVFDSGSTGSSTGEVEDGWSELVGPEDACPTKEAEAAIRLASLAARKAALLEEQRPFRPEDGRRALRAYSRARSCYEQAGRQEETARVEKTWRRLAEQVRGEVRGLQLELHRANGRDDARAALAAAEALCRIFKETDGPYADHIESVRRRLMHRVSGS